MLKVVELNEASSRTITTNEIPVGETFKGTIASTNYGLITGVFLKVSGEIKLIRNQGQPSVGPIVVRLDGKTPLGNHFSWHTCMPVTNYEPVNVTVTISSK